MPVKPLAVLVTTFAGAAAAVAAVAIVASSTGCNVPTPLAPAEPIGDVPKWGDGFATPSQAPSSMMGPKGMAGMKSPGATGDWSGGDPALGKELYANLCAKCHGANGEGNAAMGAPSFADPKWQAGIEDRLIARSVMLGKGNMPSFMNQGLDKPKLQGIVAYVRTLKAK